MSKIIKYCNKSSDFLARFSFQLFKAHSHSYALLMIVSKLLKRGFHDVRASNFALLAIKAAGSPARLAAKLY